LFGHVDQHQRDENFIGAELHAQKRRDHRPEPAAQGPRQHHEREDVPSLQRIEGQPHGGPGERADDILALGPDVPDTCLEPQGEAYGDQHQGRAFDQKLWAVIEGMFAKERLPEDRGDGLDRVFAQRGEERAAQEHCQHHR
jgi:hypothetical protein